jgi:hypothetical protein
MFGVLTDLHRLLRGFVDVQLKDVCPGVMANDVQVEFATSDVGQIELSGEHLLGTIHRSGEHLT